MTSSPVATALHESRVLLDIDSDRVLKLNPVAAEMWDLLCRNNQPELVASAIARRYQVAESKVLGDVHNLLRRMGALGVQPRPLVLTDFAPNAEVSSYPSFPWHGAGLENHPPARLGPVLFSFLALIVFDLILAIFSFRVLCKLVKSCPRRSRHFDDSEIGQICSAVGIACVWYPKKTLCLQRSAVTTCLLRYAGAPAKMVIGIKQMPFLAHAWVEINGSVVNDWPKVQSFYSAVLAK